MRFSKNLFLTFLLWVLIASVHSFAQVFPVSANITLIQPNSVYLSDYTTTNAENLRITLLQNDQLNPSYDVKLRFKIEGSGIKIQTAQDFFTTPITLTNGVPELLNGFDMAPYLEANALQFQGITRDQYRRRAAIPDGFYKVCIQVFDYRTGIALSDEICTTAWFILNDPPRLNLPACGDKLRPQDPTFMMFNWLGMQTSGGFGTEYVFQLFWIQPKGRNPNDLVLASANNPLYETTVNGTSLIYGPAEPPLFPGDQYAWRVQAKETFGRDLFKNNGYSQVCWFTYGDACMPPTDVEANVEGSQRATITWTAAPVTTKYRLDYREKNSLKWYTLYTVAEKATITDFKPATTYEYRVQSLCGTSYSEFSKVDTLRTRNPFANTVLSCGQSNNSPKVDTLLKLQTLRPGDEITVGNFKLIISEASGGSGNFKGKGSMQISLINAAVLGEFDNLKINSEYQVYAGVVNVRSGSIGLLPQDVKDKLNSYYSQVVTITDELDNMLGDAQDLIDKGTSVLDDADKAIMTSQEYLDKVKKLQEDIQGYISAAEGGNKVGKVVTGNTEPTEKLSISVSDAAQISGTSNNGKCDLKITGDDKTEQTISVVAPATIQDAKGTIYAIDNSCKAVKVAEQITLGKTPGELDALSNKAVVTFVDYAGKQKYAHSAWNQEYDKSPNEWGKRYQLLGSTYHVPARSIEPSATDFLKATINISDKSIDATKLIFASGKGMKYVSKSLGGNDYEITMVGGPAGDAQELYALYPDGSTFISFGKVLVASYKRLQRTLVLIPVNGTTAPTEDISRKLNEIYNPYCVQWEVKADANFTDMSWDENNNGLQVDGSGVLSTLTPEMVALNAAYAAARPVEMANIYLFVLPKPETAGVKGDMPRAKQFGYLFTTGYSNSDIAKTAGHEVGHGLFLLRHTFDGYGMAQNALPENMMDYSGGEKLAKLQWDVIHDPGIVLGVFEKDKDAMATDAISEIKGISENEGLMPNGQILSSFSWGVSNQTIIPTIGGSKYTIQGFRIYDSNLKSIEKIDWDYRSTTNLNLIVNTKAQDFVKIYEVVNSCIYRYQSIDWEYKSGMNVQEEVQKKIAIDNWKTNALFDADPSCFRVFVEGIIAKDNESPCVDPVNIKAGYSKLYLFITDLSKTEIELAETINTICIGSIRELKFEDFKILFKKLAKSKSLDEKKEIAILRLMSAIKSTDYAGFFKFLEENSNELSKKLITEMNDKSIYPWDGDNYTNYIGALVQMFKENPEAYINRFADTGNELLMAQVFNLNSMPFKSDFAANILLGIIPMNQFRFVGKYDENTGKVNVFRQQQFVVKGALTPIWSPDNDAIIENLDPFAPIVITTDNDLPLVETALGESSLGGAKIYIIPAIFLKYKGDKEFNEILETYAITTLDVATIVGSGGVLLATKIHWVRRVWALAELAGSVANIGVNYTDVDPKFKQSVDIYNGVMGIIGLTHVGKGIYTFTKNIPAITRDLLINNKAIKTLIIAKYLDWKIAVSNLQELTDAEKQLVTKQEQVWKMLGCADDALVKGAGKWIDEITEGTKAHVLKGEINESGSAVGCHFKGAIDNGTARIRLGATITEGPNDMFKVNIDVKDVNGNWIPKTAQSSFFPRTWDEQKILNEIQNAFINKTFVSGNTWKGLSSEGIEIRMFLKTDGTNQIITAFPIF